MPQTFTLQPGPGVDLSTVPGWECTSKKATAAPAWPAAPTWPQAGAVLYAECCADTLLEEAGAGHAAGVPTGSGAAPAAPERPLRRWWSW
jgi:hypothetical protein